MSSSVSSFLAASASQSADRLRPLRPIGRNDLDAMLEVERSAYPMPWSYGLFYDCLLAKYECHGLWQDDELVAYFIAQPVADEWHLLNICVAPSHQRQGLGRQVLRAFMAMARARTVQRLLLEVRVSNLGAQALYAQAGFKEIGRRKNYYPSLSGREDGIVMDCFLNTGANTGTGQTAFNPSPLPRVAV